MTSSSSGAGSGSRAVRPRSVVETVGSFEWEQHRLCYETHGEGPRVFVFVHGLLLDAVLNRTIGSMLAKRGHRVILPELLGHGRSDKPTHAHDYRMELWADQVRGLLDHLGVDQAVIGGVSLGANVALQFAYDHRDRVRALVVEMPVLERGTLVGAAAFLPLIMGLRYAPRAWQPISWLARQVPPTGHPLDSFVNLLTADPLEIVAVLQGLFVGPTTPPERARRRLDVPTLVLGHSRDVLHPLDDAEALAREMSDSTFIRAHSILEARTRPRRVVDELDRFLRAAWEPRPVTQNEHARSGGAQPDPAGR